LGLTIALSLQKANQEIIKQFQQILQG